MLNEPSELPHPLRGLACHSAIVILNFKGLVHIGAPHKWSVKLSHIFKYQASCLLTKSGLRALSINTGLLLAVGYFRT